MNVPPKDAMRDRQDTLPLDADTLAELQSRARRDDAEGRPPLPTIPFELRPADSIPLRTRRSQPGQSTGDEAVDASRSSPELPIDVSETEPPRADETTDPTPPAEIARGRRGSWLLFFIVLMAAAAAVTAYRGWLPV